MQDAQNIDIVKELSKIKKANGWMPSQPDYLSKGEMSDIAAEILPRVEAQTLLIQEMYSLLKDINLDLSAYECLPRKTQDQIIIILAKAKDFYNEQ